MLRAGALPWLDCHYSCLQ